MRHAVHQSLVVPNLVWGVERPLALVVLITSAALVFGIGFKLETLAIAAVLMTAGMGGLRIVAKYDPQFSAVYLRHLTYQHVYPATGSVVAKMPRIQKTIPTRADLMAIKLW